jgi:hypothetical protein
MFALEMLPILIMPSVLFWAASLTALILIDPKVTIIVLSKAVFGYKDTATPPHTFEDFFLMLRLTFALSYMRNY